MEWLNDVFPIILYTLGSILLVVMIVLVIHLIRTIKNLNVTLNDIQDKSKKLDNLFTVIDNATDALANISDKFIYLIVNAITGVISKFKNKGGEEENE